MTTTQQRSVREVALRPAAVYPDRLRPTVLVISSVMAAAGTALCLMLQRGAWEVGALDWIQLLVLLQWFHVRGWATYNPRWPVLTVSAHNVVIILGVFLLPPGLLPLLAAGYLLRMPVLAHWRAWNFGACVLALSLASATWHAVGLDALGSRAIGATLAIVAFWIVETSAANWVNWYADHVNPAASGLWAARGIALDLAILSVGAMAGLAIVTDRQMLVLAVPAVLLVVAGCGALGRAQVSTYDGKTGLLAATTLSTWGARELELARRRGSPVSLVMIDIDWFRRVNNTFGHLTGDLVLRHVAELLVQASRSTDLVFRYGGEELTLLLPDTDLEDARLAAERFRRLLDSTPAMTPDGPVHVTASAGVACRADDETLDAVIARADRALLDAKAAGRNQVVAYGPGAGGTELAQ